MRSLTLATLFSALSGFVVTIIAARALGTERYDYFAAFWGLFFAICGFLDGMMQETTRGVTSARAKQAAAGASPWRLAGIVAVVVAVVVAASAPLWVGRLLDADQATGAALLTIGLLSYAFQAVLSGVLSGLELWSRFAWLLGLDAGLRLVLALAAWAAGWGMVAFFLMTVVGALSWLVVLLADARVNPHTRRRFGAYLRAHVDVPLRVLARRAGSAMVASGASAALIMGYPVFVKATIPPEVSASAILMGVLLTRAPILVPMSRFQSVLIVRFVAARERLFAALAMPVVTVLGVGVVGAVAAFFLGPWLLTAFSGADYYVSGTVLAILTFASSCTGTLMITGTATIAVEEHGWYVAGWVTASAVAFAVLTLPLSLSAAVCASLIIGPVAGGLVHAVGLFLRRRRIASLPAVSPVSGAK